MQPAITILLLNFLFVSSTLAAPAEDLVTNLPGLNFDVSFKHYSGYLNASAGEHFHYWFVESQGDPAKDPLMLWLNGGPGCSSMLGLLTENGPFHLNAAGTVVVENPYAWNKVASIVYIESPAGVGYSYKDTGSIYTGDNKTMVSNYNALLSFFAKFPEYKKNKFYVSGESYAGVYLPTLAADIVSHKDFPGNFQGALIGNGLLSWPLNGISVMSFFYQHGVIGDLMYQSVLDSCNLTNIMNCKGMELSSAAMHTPPWYVNNSDCQIAYDTAYAMAGQLDPYNIYFSCYPTNGSRATQDDGLAKPWSERGVRKAYASHLPRWFDGGVHCREPFGDTATINYLNSPAVRKALHIPASLNVTWETCNMDLNQHYDRSQYRDMSGPMRVILGAKKRVLVYNGDVDSACNFLGDQCFVQSLNRKPNYPWQAWTYSGDISPVAGFAVSYDLIDFVTVRGSGHFVPTTKPREALQMLVNFLNGQRNYSMPASVNVQPAPLIGGADRSSAVALPVWLAVFALVRIFTL